MTVGLHFPLVAALHQAGDHSRLEISLQHPRAASCPQPQTLLLGGTPRLPAPPRAPPSPVLVALAEGSWVVTMVMGAELTFVPQATLSRYTGSLPAWPCSEPHRCDNFTMAAAVD